MENEKAKESDFDMSVVKRQIEFMCTFQGITLKELADKIGLLEDELLYIFDNGTVSVNYLFMIAKVLQVNPALLLGELYTTEPNPADALFEKLGNIIEKISNTFTQNLTDREQKHKPAQVWYVNDAQNEMTVVGMVRITTEFVYVIRHNIIREKQYEAAIPTKYINMICFIEYSAMTALEYDIPNPYAQLLEDKIKAYINHK